MGRKRSACITCTSPSGTQDSDHILWPAMCQTICFAATWKLMMAQALRRFGLGKGRIGSGAFSCRQDPHPPTPELCLACSALLCPDSSLPLTYQQCWRSCRLLSPIHGLWGVALVITAYRTTGLLMQLCNRIRPGYNRAASFDSLPASSVFPAH